MESDWKTKYFLTREGFFERFNEIVKTGKTKKAAYEQCESERMDHCKPCMYAGWHSFKFVMYSKIKKEMK